MLGTYKMLHLAFGLLLLGAGTYGVTGTPPGGDRSFPVVLVYCGVFSLLASGGFALRSRLLGTLFSLPVAVPWSMVEVLLAVAVAQRIAVSRAHEAAGGPGGAH